MATALSGYAVWAVTRPSGDAERIDRLEADLDRLRVIETRVANLEGAHGAPGMTAPRPLEPTALASAPKIDAASATPAERVAAKASEERIADLTKRLAAIEEKQKADEATGAAVPGRIRLGGPRGGTF